MIDGMIARFEEELGCNTTVIATGGIARFILPLCRREIQYDKNLILKGLAKIYRDNVHPTPVVPEKSSKQ